MALELEFIGHASFRFWEDERPVLITDPYTHEALKIPFDGRLLDAETVIVSSLTDRGHDNVKWVRGNPRIINAYDLACGKGEATINGEPVITVEAAEIANHPEGTDPNALYAFKIGGLWFVHMGDLGFGLSNERIEPFKGRCDVLFALVGENLTLKLEELDPMIEYLQPKWIFPMHYEIPPIEGWMSRVDRFLEHRKHDPVVVVRHHTVTFPLPRLSPDRPTIVVLEPSSYQPTGGLVAFHTT